MSTRKQTVDDIDDIDDEDGAVEEETAQESDLTLVVESADDAILGSDSPNATEDQERLDEEEA